MAKKNQATMPETQTAVTAPGETKFAQESKALSGPSPTMLAMFAPKPALESALGSLTRRNLPAMIKPDAVPVGGVITARILAIVDSPVSTIKGCLLHLALGNLDAPTPTDKQTVKLGKDLFAFRPTGLEITFPCTGTIRNALVGALDGQEKVKVALEKEIGKLIVLKRQEDKPSKKFARNMFMFDVFTSEKSIDIKPD